MRLLLLLASACLLSACNTNVKRAQATKAHMLTEIEVMNEPHRQPVSLKPKLQAPYEACVTAIVRAKGTSELAVLMCACCTDQHIAKQIKPKFDPEDAVCYAACRRDGGDERLCRTFCYSECAYTDEYWKP